MAISLIVERASCHHGRTGVRRVAADEAC